MAEHQALNDHQALQALEGVLAQVVLPCSFAQAKALITIISAGLVERDGFREQLAAKDAAGAAPTPEPATGPEVRTLPFKNRKR